MAKRAKNPKVDAFCKDEPKWNEEIVALRKIALSTELTEDFKWGKPCYTVDDGNIIIITPLKESVALAFCKGVLLKDPKKILKAPGENSQSGRWVKFTSTTEINKAEKTLKAYIEEAIGVEKSGKEVPYKETSEYPVPVELTAKFRTDPLFKAAFEKLTPGRQRGWLLHFAAPKQSATRDARIDKAAPLIYAGKGMHDDYKERSK